MSKAYLDIYTIYENPLDWPGEFVIKKWVVKSGSTTQDLSYLYNSKDLEQCRDQMRAKGLHRIPRDPGDDPVVYESWM